MPSAPQFRSEFLRTFAERGAYYDCSAPTDLDALFLKERVTAYIGFDCTASSMHIGNLVQLMTLRRLQQAGHRPILLMGGGTTKLGDPSGKDDARKLLSNTEIEANKKSMLAGVSHLLKFGSGPTDAIMVDNAEWLDKLEYIPFLRDIGRHFSVNRMLTMDSVKLRLDREQPLSFLEFNYMVCQAYDFVEQQLQTRGLAAEEEDVLPGANAWDLVWKPLETALAGTKRVYVSLDGALNEVPLGIIAAPDGNVAMEKYDLRILSSTKDILRNAAPVLGNRTALLLGDPEFNLNDEQESAAMKKLVLKSSSTQSGVELTSQLSTSPSTASARELPRLPGTGAEVATIAGLMNAKGWKTSLYTRDAALKVVVQQAESPVVVHLATHGFFLPDQPNKVSRGDSVQNRNAVIEDPMLRSGLYFAGADRTLAGTPTAVGLDNGILTAMEAANLNLSGTELVVLSACNTGQGDLRAGEGVFGLRRALQEAGARAVLMSMWSVPDKETTELMQRFYAKWLAGTEMHEALKQAQLEIREEVKREHGGHDLPYYWGAFVLVGR